MGLDPTSTTPAASTKVTGFGRWMRPLAWATLLSNAMLVVTGGAVRLTGSGLGCSTWPRCTEDAFTPRDELTMHAAIEFGNRLLTFVLAAIAVATVIAAWQLWRQQRRLDVLVIALFIALGIPVQAVVGGVSVLLELNPWVVSLHLLASLAIICLAVLLLWRIEHPRSRVTTAPSPIAWLAWLSFITTWVVLYLGTIVTGSGPHAGDADAPRNGLDPLELSQLHADAVFLLLGLVVALAIITRRTTAVALVCVLLVQGYVGYTQYFTGLPTLLVGIHMFGAAVVSAVMMWMVLDLTESDVSSAQLEDLPS